MGKCLSIFKRATIPNVLLNHNKQLLNTDQYLSNASLVSQIGYNDLLIFGYCRQYMNLLFILLSYDIIDFISRFCLCIHTNMIKMDGKMTCISVTVGYKLKPLSYFPSIRNDIYVKKRKGKYYYEFMITNIDDNSSNLAQIGWCDDKCSPNDNKLTGIGDDQHSWAFDGGRVTKWHNGDAGSYGKKWNIYDVVGCCIDIHQNNENIFDVSYYLNNEFLGIAFSNCIYFGNIYAACSLQPGYCHGQIIFRKDKFKYLPDGYEPIF